MHGTQQEQQLAVQECADQGRTRFDRVPTAQQQRTLSGLGVARASVRQAAVGSDLFAYVEDAHSTLRLQIAADGVVVGQTVLNRQPQNGSATGL